MVTHHVQFPSPFDPAHYNISQISVRNTGNLGYVHRLSGGPRRGFVVFYFESEKNKGLHFDVDIYGYPKDLFS